MKIYPINTIKLNNISFKKNPADKQTPNQAILSLQNPNAGIDFEKNFQLTQNSDAVQANPLTALGCKLYKTYKMIFAPHITPKQHREPPSDDFWIYQSLYRA